MKGVFIPDVTVDEIRSICLEGLERLLAEGVVLDVDTDATRPKTHWIRHDDPDEVTYYECDCCGVLWTFESGGLKENELNYCPKCGAIVREEKDGG